MQLKMQHQLKQHFYIGWELGEFIKIIPTLISQIVWHHNINFVFSQQILLSGQIWI